MSSKKLRGGGSEKSLPFEEQQAKVNEIRKLIGPRADKFPALCSDASILRYLRARNWNTKKASKMLKETMKWRLEYKPETIRWLNGITSTFKGLWVTPFSTVQTNAICLSKHGTSYHGTLTGSQYSRKKLLDEIKFYFIQSLNSEHIAQEAETGKIYKANYCDKHGRPVLIMRPGFQNTSSIDGQIRYLVYCMENAIMDLKPDQDQDQMDHYPERLGLGILYNPPKIFESFWLMVKPFIEPRTHKKVKFVYSDDPQSRKLMEDYFDMDKLESAFGGKNSGSFDYKAYAERMIEADMKRSENLTTSGCPSPSLSIMSDIGSELSEEGGFSSNDENASNLEGVHEKPEDHPPGSKDVADVGVHVSKEIKIDEPA